MKLRLTLMIQNTTSPPSLTPEECFLWDCARLWRTPAHLTDPGPLDWTRVIEIGKSNRMQPLLGRVLSATDQMGALPL